MSSDGDTKLSEDEAAFVSSTALESPAADAQTLTRKLGVLVGSDDPFTRQAFLTGASTPEIDVLGGGSLATVSEQLAPQLQPEIVLLDVQTTAVRALRTIQQIRAGVAGARILACSTPAGTEFGLLCLSAGAWGYVSKEMDLEALPPILHALARGEAVIPQALATELVRRFVRATPVDGLKSAELSSPESRLLELLRTGSTLPEAASELDVTLATARRHFGRVRRKLSVPPPGSDSKSRDGSDRNHD